MMKIVILKTTKSLLYYYMAMYEALFFSSGMKKGDRVAIYMPMIIELTVALLACARLGIIHSIVVM